MKLATTKIDIESYLKRFRVFIPKSLFPPDFNLLREQRCPICTRKLAWSRDGKILRCKSKMKDKFFIRREVYEKICHQ